ncbi:MAG: hypothetical protein ACPGVU_07685 [Limisphaerales bacterium]
MKRTLAQFAISVSLLCSSALHASAAEVSIRRTPKDGRQPRVETGKDGTAHLIYFKGDPRNGDVFYAQRRTGQSEFGRPIKVNSRPGSAVAAGTIRGAHLALGKNDRVHVAWMGSGKTAPHSPKSKHPLHPMLYTRMNDAGTGFEPERNLVNYAWGLDGGGSVAADSKGNVYVFWHADPTLKPMNEAGRSVFMTKSTNDGKDFAREENIVEEAFGACGCCGMKAFVDSGDRVFALYRTASRGSRDMNVLFAPPGGRTFVACTVNRWKLEACPMSSSNFGETKANVLFGTERAGKLFVNSFDRESARLNRTVELTLGRRAKHPAIAVNSKGEILVAWQEGASFHTGGTLHYQTFDASGQSTSRPQRVGKVPKFSLASVYADPEGRFGILY